MRLQAVVEVDEVLEVLGGVAGRHPLGLRQAMTIIKT